MVKLKINGKSVEVKEGTTILDAASEAGIMIPTLCFLKGINEIGACRVCVVEVKDCAKLVTACNNEVWDGMEVFTNSPKVRESRRNNVELILSQHDCKCATCVRSGNCSLQTIANDLGILNLPFEIELPKSDWPLDFPLIRDSGKCIKCMRCVQVCDKIQGLNIWDVAGTGSRTTVDVSKNRKINESDCALCGQCITHCPVGALRERDDRRRVLDALADPEKITVVQLAPAVRTSWGESFGLSREFATVKRLVAALRQIGFDYIFDTNFSADLTIMEEGSEFLERLKKGDLKKYPMFTSCCPGWVRFMKSQYPDMVDQLSTAKSPQQMFGAIAKSYYAQLLNVDPSRIFSLSIMPCIAKKQEAMEEHTNIDYVITFEELAAMFISQKIYLKDYADDNDEWEASIYGRNFAQGGGVSKAVIQAASEAGEEGVTAYYADGAFECKKQLMLMKLGKFTYDILEGMCCDGGCIGGPSTISDAFEVRKRMNKENEKHVLKINEALLKSDIDTSKYHIHRDK